MASIENKAASPPDQYLSARQKLLDDPRQKPLSFREVRKAGWQLANNPNDLSIYGMSPFTWYALGLRIIPRTAVELTRDLHAAFLASAIKRTFTSLGIQIADVIDPFAGSGNTLFHVATALHAQRAIGIEHHPIIADLTNRNFHRLRMFGRLRKTNAEIIGGNWTDAPNIMRDRPTLIFLSPPWGEAFNSDGLDLSKTTPPIDSILRTLSAAVRTSPLFVAVQSYPKTVTSSVDELTKRYKTHPTHRSTDPAIFGSLDYLLLELPGI